MSLKIKRIEQATIILKGLEEESIQSIEDGNPFVCAKLTTLRTEVLKFTTEGKLFAPGFTTSTIITLLKIAGCNELSQRFIVDYYIAYPQETLNLVYLTNPKNSEQNHAIVVIGEVIASPQLFGKDRLTNSEKNLPIETFLGHQSKDIVIADPLLNACGEKAVTTLQAYCEKNKITDVCSILNFNTQALIDNVKLIKAESIRLTPVINQKIALNQLNQFITPAFLQKKTENQWKFSARQKYFYLTDNECTLKILYDQLKRYFSKNELLLVDGENSSKKYLIIKKDANELDYAKLLEITPFHQGVVKALLTQGLLASPSRTSSDDDEERQSAASTLPTSNP